MQKSAEVHYLTKKPFTSILTTNPYISKVYTIDQNISEVITDLRKEKYDYIIDLHHNLRSFLVKWKMPWVKSYSFKKLNFEKWLLTSFKINQLPEKHIVDRYLETAKPLGVVNDGLGLDFFLGEDMPSFQNLAYLKKCEPDNYLPPTPSRGGDNKVRKFTTGNYTNNYIAFPIGAGRNTKALTVEKIIHICQSLNYPIVLLGGKQEIEKARLIEEKVGLTLKVVPTLINLVGKCSLLESAAIVKNAKVVLTGDTGLMHIAAAFCKPIISIWGNTVPEFGMYPYYPKEMDLNTSIEVKELPCRPCSKIGYDVCPKGHFSCIEQLKVKLIINQLEEVIKG